MKKNKKTIYAWACDIENYRGEGILGINFLKQLSQLSKKKIYVESPNKKILVNNQRIKILSIEKKKKINFNFLYNYFYPIYGIIKIYQNYPYYKNFCYVNFLPLWNIFLFIFLPQKTIYGPITGSIYTGNSYNISSFLRKFIIPIFYKISLKLIKNETILFSTSLLKRFNKKNKFKKIFYDYNLVNYEKKNYRNKKRDIDFLFYYRSYSAHGSNLQKKIIKKLADDKFKIYVIGDEIIHKNIINLSIIDRLRVNKYLFRTKYTINEATNFFSIFCLDAISCGVKVFYDKRISRNQKFFPKKYFKKIDLSKVNLSVSSIKKEIKKYKQIKKISFNKNKYSKLYDDYFLSYLDENK